MLVGALIIDHEWNQIPLRGHLSLSQLLVQTIHIPIRMWNCKNPVQSQLRTILQRREENLVTNTSGEYSGTRKTRKRKGKLDQALDDITVSNKSQEQNMLNDMQPPQLHSSERQTRSSNTVS